MAVALDTRETAWNKRRANTRKIRAAASLAFRQDKDKHAGITGRLERRNEDESRRFTVALCVLRAAVFRKFPRALARGLLNALTLP